MPKIEIYTTQICPFCHAAKELLHKKQIAFTEIDVGRDPQLRATMTERAGAQHTTVPQIFIDNTHIGGCDDLYALEQNQKLDALLQL